VIFEDLESLGVPPAKFQRVHAPIGLKIGAMTVPEIAVSIAAELIQVRRAEAH
jgi:xanthine dehydrogenase accessory factor